MISVKIVESTCHLSKSFIGVNHNHLRCLKFLSRFKLPLKTVRMNPHHHSDLIKLIILCHHLEITGINKIHRIDFSMLLISSPCLNCHKWMILMTGLPTGRFNAEFPMAYRNTLNMALSCPGAMKRNCLKIFIIHIKAGTVYLCQMKESFSCIYHLDASGNHIYIFKYRIRKYRLKTCNGILTGNLKRTTFFFRSERSRQAYKRLFSTQNFVRYIVHG